MRTLAPIAVAALLLLAGCGGGAGPSTSTPAPTATDTPTSTPAPEASATPPKPADVEGVNESGVNASALTLAHRDALTNRSLTLDLDIVTNGSEMSITQYVAEDTRIRMQQQAGNRSRATYVANGTRYQKMTAGGETSYNQINQTRGIAHPSSYTASRIMWRYMTSATYEPNGTTVRNGTGLIVLEANEGSLNESALSQANMTVTSFESKAYVDSRGVIHEFTYTAEGTQNGTQFSQSIHITVSDVGSTTVTRPAWVDRA